ERAYDLTIKGNSVAVVSNGSAVLGLGNIGPEGSLPVMEGKAVLFKKFADIDAYPIVLDTQKPEEIIKTVKLIAPGFGGINLEDIGAPDCFEIEAALQDIGIPVFHDDQHGTAIVVYAGLLNAAKVIGKPFGSLKVVILGAGAAGTAVARMLSGLGAKKSTQKVKQVRMLNRSGVLTAKSPRLSTHQRELVKYINPKNERGDLQSALKDADVFIGVSGPNAVSAEMVKSMAKDAIIFAMANPDPEILPSVAKKAGAAVVATGRSDFPNQVNNVLAFPGVFRGALNVRSARITEDMKQAAAVALAGIIKQPRAGRILPSPLDNSVAPAVAKAVQRAS
ncbi:NADP-dependent malic enzyme, partial [Patescibacteria group bacterium]|nr:NADP-dependent malic enzyme [Patescibacteria group bacterium]